MNSVPSDQGRVRICIPGQLRSTAVRMFVATVMAIAACGSTALAQSYGVAQMLEQQDQWETWAQEGRKLQIDGRFEGRTAQMFRLMKLPVTLHAPRNNPLPDKLRPGQRIEVSGRLRMQNGKLMFEVNRLAIGETDIEQLQSRAKAIADNEWKPQSALAEEFDRIAEFYDDDSLRDEVRKVQRQSIQNERRNQQKSFDGLRAVMQRAQELKLDDRLIAEIRFESLIAAWQSGQDRPGLLRRIETELKGWDQKNGGWNESRETKFRRSPATGYDEASDVDRLLWHRRLYRAVQVEQIKTRLLPDGSNGIAVAAELRDAVPEESALAAQYEQREIDLRLQRVTKLTRAELQQMADLLKQHMRDGEIAPAVDTWVRNQERRFTSTGLAGIIRAADEYLFVADRWQRAEHRQHGLDLLKQAWELANQESPVDAAAIADRLKRFGWERLNDRWMTSSQIEALPDDDVQLAMREGRVVRGMTAAQVAGTLGQPQNVSRIISARTIRELWIYNAPGSAGVIVQFERHRGETPAAARVSTVSRSTPR